MNRPCSVTVLSKCTPAPRALTRTQQGSGAELNACSTLVCSRRGRRYGAREARGRDLRRTREKPTAWIGAPRVRSRSRTSRHRSLSSVVRFWDTENVSDSPRKPPGSALDLRFQPLHECFQGGPLDHLRDCPGIDLSKVAGEVQRAGAPVRNPSKRKRTLHPHRSCNSQIHPPAHRTPPPPIAGARTGKPSTFKFRSN
mgnify:CR=1 FL=1